MTKGKIAAAVAVAALATTAGAAEVSPLKVQGTELLIPATVELSFPNDQAVITLYAETQDADLLKAQSDVNAKMAKGTQLIKEFSKIAKISNAGYYSQPIYTRAKEGETSQLEAWRVRQSIRVETEDVEGVPALVQVAQGQLALSNVRFGLTDITRKQADDKLIAASLATLTKRAQTAAESLNVPQDAIKLEVVDFNPEGRGFTDYAPRMMSAMVRNKGLEVEMPAFEAGESILSMTVRAKLKLVP